jgi:hypothetical protein
LNSLYQSNDGTEEKVFDALEWLAAMRSHVPNKGEHPITLPKTIFKKS